MLSRLPSALCSSLLAALAAAAAAAAAADRSCTTSTITLHAWPLSSPTATPLARVLETACPSTPKSYSLSDWTPPPHESAEYQLVRVGRYTEPASASDGPLDHWDGILTSSASFTPGRGKTLALLTDGEGKLAHVDFGASRRGLGAGGADNEVAVVVRHPTPGMQPVLNKPVVLDESGRVRDEQKDERSFLQKYWWVIGLFLLMQVVSGGSKE